MIAGKRCPCRVSLVPTLVLTSALLAFSSRAHAQRESWEEKAPPVGAGGSSAAPAPAGSGAGTSGRLSPQRIDEIVKLAGDSASFFTKNKIPFEVRSGGGSFFDPRTRTMVLDANASAAQQAQALVFESRRQQIDARKNDIRVDLGNKEFDEVNFRTNGHADPALRDKFQPKTRDEFVNDKLDTVAQAATDVIEFNRQLRDRGVATDPAPLESVYTEAFNRTFSKEFAEELGKTGDANAADSDARRRATQAARRAVLQAVMNGKLRTSDGRQTFVELADKEFAAREAERAKKAAELAKAQAEAKAKADQQAKRLAVIKALAELVNRTDPNSPDADKVIRLVDALTGLMSASEKNLFIDHFGADKGLDKLLGPFGFRVVDGVDVGGLQVDRLEYALAVYASLNKDERDLVRRDPFAAIRKGIQIAPTPKELEAQDRLVAVRKLPDGTLHVGPLSEFKQAVEQNRINHALEQLQQIRGAGAFSLLGRLVECVKDGVAFDACGENGAVIGTGGDLLLMFVAPAIARSNQAREIAKMGGGGTGGPRPVVVELRPPPRRNPAEERPRPAGQTVELVKPPAKAPPPANASLPKPPQNGNPPAQPARPQDPGAQLAFDKTQPAPPPKPAQNGNPPAQNNPGDPTLPSIGPPQSSQPGKPFGQPMTVTRGGRAYRVYPQQGDNQQFTIKTPRGRETVTGLEYRLRLMEAEQFVTEQHLKPSNLKNVTGAGPPKELYQEAQRKFGLDDGWYRASNPLKDRIAFGSAKPDPFGGPSKGRLPGSPNAPKANSPQKPNTQGQGALDPTQQPPRAKSQTSGTEQKTGEITRPGATKPGSGNTAKATEGTPGHFGSEDIAFGLSKPKGKAGALTKFAGNANDGSNLPISGAVKNVGTSKLAVNEAIAGETVKIAKAYLTQSGGKLRFSLEGFDVKGALDPKSPGFESVTSAELRSVLSDPFFRGRVRFYDPVRGDVTDEILALRASK